MVRSTCHLRMTTVALVFTQFVLGCGRDPVEPCSAVLGIDTPTLLTLQVGHAVELTAAPAACVPAGLAWEVSRPAVAQIMSTGGRTATLGPVAPGSGILTVRGATGGLLVDLPYQVLPPDLPPLTRDTSALLQTDKVSYMLVPTEVAWQTQIQVTFFNRLSEPVTVIPCLGLKAAELQKREGSEWTRAYVWIHPLPPCFDPATLVEPGATVDVTLDIRAGYPWGQVGFPHAFLTTGVAGIYRLTWSEWVLRTGGPGGEPLADIRRVSNPFTFSVALAPPE